MISSYADMRCVVMSYIRMDMRVVLFLTLLTGMCVADSTGNLALRATVVQSSTYSTDVAQRAVDGNMDSNYNLGSCTCTNAEKKPWWRVDLGKVYRVTRVRITGSVEYSVYINGAQIRIGNSLENNGNNNEVAANVGSIPAGVTTMFEFKPINGRYVNILLPSDSAYLILCEVEVFAGEGQREKTVI
ncbi:hypothetical protein PO909_005120 [Leuciscus waleckii]